MCNRYWQQPRGLVPKGVHVQNDLIKCYHTTNIQSSNGVDGDDELDLNELMLDETAILIPTEKKHFVCNEDSTSARTSFSLIIKDFSSHCLRIAIT